MGGFVDVCHVPKSRGRGQKVVSPLLHVIPFDAELNFAG